jgi:hypothetical protein
MPKWKSPLFSDIRNAIGDNVVFSMWKGRPFFRAYVIPANPNTNKQKAERLNAGDLVKRWQEIVVGSGVKAAWNESALPFLISGYNLFLKYGRGIDLQVSPTSGSGVTELTFTYDNPIPAAKAALFKFANDAWSDITPVEGLEVGKEKVAVISDTISYDSLYFIALVDTDTAEGDLDEVYQAISKWHVNQSAGTNDECKVTKTT